MTVKVPQEVEAYLTPEQVKELERRYRARNAGDALGALLLAMAGLFVLAAITEDSKPKPRRTRRHKVG